MAQWTEELAVGITEIDNQHKELFAQINGLIEACNAGKGKETVQQVIDFLGQYVVNHFGNEEKYMVKHNYPEYTKHKEQHTQFIASFQELKNKFEQDGPGIHIVVLTNRVVVDWLNQHISRSDKALGAFLKDKL